jgi:cell division protein FtsL
MSEEDLKEILSKYQQKAFELFNSNIVLETQVSALQKQVNALTVEIEKLRKSKRIVKTEDDFS